jgi:hypothetical protein
VKTDFPAADALAEELELVVDELVVDELVVEELEEVEPLVAEPLEPVEEEEPDDDGCACPAEALAWAGFSSKADVWIDIAIVTATSTPLIAITARAPPIRPGKSGRESPSSASRTAHATSTPPAM